jgi:hypothetical protein
VILTYFKHIISRLVVRFPQLLVLSLESGSKVSNLIGVSRLVTNAMRAECSLASSITTVSNIFFISSMKSVDFFRDCIAALIVFNGKDGASDVGKGGPKAFERLGKDEIDLSLLGSPNILTLELGVKCSIGKAHLWLELCPQNTGLPYG